MLYDALVAESRRDDSFDDVRTAALARAREPVSLLERQWAEHAGGAGPDEAAVMLVRVTAPTILRQISRGA